MIWPLASQKTTIAFFPDQTPPIFDLSFVYWPGEPLALPSAMSGKVGFEVSVRPVTYPKLFSPAFNESVRVETCVVTLSILLSGLVGV